MKLRKNTPLEQRYSVSEAGCWEWLGCLNGCGYGVFRLNGKLVRAHRYFYEKKHGAIGSGLDLDHLCRNRKCCNPDHLEAVSRKVNLLRGETVTAANAAKESCPRGHLYDADNTAHYKTKRGGIGRWCRTCARERVAARHAGKYAEWLRGEFRPTTKRRESALRNPNHADLFEFREHRVAA